LKVVFVRTGLQTRPMCVITRSDGSGESSAQKCEGVNRFKLGQARAEARTHLLERPKEHSSRDVYLILN
jgi:hypothetical protein